MNKKTSMLLALLGSTLALYNANLYGFFSLLMAPLYFPLSNPLASYIAALGAFAVGFIMRPIGGLIFGHIGDIYGRKKAFILSILLTTMGTCTIGILPSYDVIGIAAPLVLVCCLGVQGSCIAGAYTGAAILIAEYSKQHSIGFACSLSPTSGTIGLGVAALLGAIFTLESLPDWAWRIPFLLSIIGGILVLFMHHHVVETPAFKQADDHQRREKYPLMGILKNHRRNFLCAIGISIASTAGFYVFMMYTIGLSVNADQSLSLHQSMLVNTGMMILLIIFLPLMGAISDKIGMKRLMQYGSMAAALVAVPLFWLMHQDISVTKVSFVMAVFAILHAGFVGPSGAFLVYLFPPQERYTGVGFAMALGGAFAGAITPIIILLLMQVTDDGVASALYLMFCYFIGWLSVHKAHLVAGYSQRDDLLEPGNYTALVKKT